MFLRVIYGRYLFCCGLPVVLLSDLAQRALDKGCVIRWTKRYIIITLIISITDLKMGFGQVTLADATALTRHGWELLCQGRCQEAIEEFSRAIKLDENFAEAYNNRSIGKQIAGEQAPKYQQRAGMLYIAMGVIHGNTMIYIVYRYVTLILVDTWGTIGDIW